MLTSSYVISLFHSDNVADDFNLQGQMGDGDQLERAFAGATVHDCFNFLR